MVLALFLVGSHKAWLNPRPDFHPTCKASQTYPFMWQYNMDAYWEFLSAAEFPEVFKTYSLRVNRPLYPALVHLIGKVYYLALWPLKTLTDHEAAFLGYITLKILVFILFSLIYFHLLRRFCDDQVALFGVCLLLSQRFILDAISTFHTYELEIISPTILIFLFLNLLDRYSLAKNIVFSLIAGMLLLGRQNYAIYLAIICFGLYKRQFAKVGVSFICHALPLALWLLYLHLAGISYVNHEVSNDSMLLWLFKPGSGPLDYIELLGTTLNRFLMSWDPWLLFGIFWLGGQFARGRNLTRDQFVFFALALLITYAQFVASKKMSSYLTGDMWFLAYGLAAAGIYQLLGQWPARVRQTALGAIVAGRLVWDILRWMESPWVHPLKQ